MTKLLLPFTPEEFLREPAAHKAAHPAFGIEHVHFFALCGVAQTASCDEHGRSTPAPLPPPPESFLTWYSGPGDDLA